MEKNTFMIYNNIIYSLYSCKCKEDLITKFLIPLKALIPYSYASIVFADISDNASTLYLPEPICVPESFKSAETEYIRFSHEDPLLWMIQGQESNLVRESDLVADESRLNSSLYIRCYKKYNIFDTLQYSVVYQQKFLGVITLFRTRIDGFFSDDEMFFMRSIGVHTQSVLNSFVCRSNNAKLDREKAVQKLSADYGLTNRERSIVSLLAQFKTNQEISDELSISEHTIQKHLQNIFRKLNIFSKWELMKYIENEDN